MSIEEFEKGAKLWSRCWPNLRENMSCKSRFIGITSEASFIKMTWNLWKETQTIISFEGSYSNTDYVQGMEWHWPWRKEHLFC